MAESRSTPRSERLLREAARWSARIALNGTLEPSTQVRFDAWLASAGAPEAYARVSGVLAASDGYEGALRAVHARARKREAGARRISSAAMAVAGGALLIAAAAGADIPARTADEWNGGRTVRIVTLQDDSTVWIDAGGAVNVDYSSDERRLELVRGQIYVRASHEDRPFVVAAGGGEAIDIGTEFVVRLLKDGAEVQVAEGAVRVDSGGGERLLRQGEAARWSRGDRPSPVPALPSELAGSWRAGFIHVRDRPLGEVIRDVNRRSPKPYLLWDSTTSSRRVSGVIRAERLEETFGALARTQGLEVVDLGVAYWLRAPGR